MDWLWLSQRRTVQFLDIWMDGWFLILLFILLLALLWFSSFPLALHLSLSGWFGWQLELWLIFFSCASFLCTIFPHQICFFFFFSFLFFSFGFVFGWLLGLDFLLPISCFSWLIWNFFFFGSVFFPTLFVSSYLSYPSHHITPYHTI
ncbi:hypothetical protein BO70DRAFT_183001 [Aspergillus heteromorphus CBS 117.55]|uniref:Uncharacterized protein n=1 Tax=Aspergillus heteromorphus CBS 117.55 TaxID=1448321 RepID=A0A317WR01_9EURO|nr:uncharacterized protein BO70DRAFT_183001 [Aspergillus heteromorphus CBS 117.55]PWY88485.1 hypothetical protein BO70DRAFT_183001 [Aspergillus heteromorphus CBS 117.55]